MKSFLLRFFTLVTLGFSWTSYASSDVFPFDYDLHLTRIEGTTGRTLICFHGLAANYQVADRIKLEGNLHDTLISFNFPEYDLLSRITEVESVTLGTVKELLPAAWVLKKCVTEMNMQVLNIYAFSNGAGVFINLLSALNTSRFDSELKQIGILAEDKRMILDAIERGFIILDSPLKSVSEVIDHQYVIPEILEVAKRYQTNDLEPIDQLKHLENLALHVILHFQKPDDTLTNRDDDLYIERLMKANSKGTVEIVYGTDGGHLAPHTTLWNYYQKRNPL